MGGTRENTSRNGDHRTADTYHTDAPSPLHSDWLLDVDGTPPDLAHPAALPVLGAATGREVLRHPVLDGCVRGASEWWIDA